VKRRLAFLFGYAVAMAFVESAVVVYLRTMLPAAAALSAAIPFPPLVYRTEVLREVATMVMLVAVAYLAFDRLALKAVTFVWVFAIWDLFYYVFLKLLIGWPASLAANDVLFLIPRPWVAPVWVPLLVWTIALGVSSWLLFRIGTRPRPDMP
jgi:hypothetical protein